MATNGIWKIDKRLDNVLKYTTNADKTKNENYNNEFYCNLHNVIDYVEADYKTEKKLYVSALNCSVETAEEEMILTKKRFNKTGGILGFHAFQSFSEGEVSPEMAHEIGVKLAEEMWGDRFEVVISTHLNTKHYHNHFVVNSVSFVDGKRYYDNRTTYAEFRKVSNLICEEYGLNTLKEKSCKRSKINYANYQKGNYEKNNYYTRAKEDLDRAILQAYDYKDFCNLMKLMDYDVMIRYNRISIRRKGYKKNIRIERCFGEDYTIEKLNERIETTSAPRIPFIEVFGNTKYEINKNNYTKPKIKGIYGLYLHYCYLLKVFPVKYPKQKLSPQIRLDINKMEKISEEARLLVSKDLKTNEQFFLYREEKIKRRDELTEKRYELWNKHKKSKNIEEKKKISKQIDTINEELEPLRKEVVLCDDILERSKKIEDNLSQEEIENGKEVNKNEFIR